MNKIENMILEFLPRTEAPAYERGKRKSFNCYYVISFRRVLSLTTPFKLCGYTLRLFFFQIE